MGANHRAASHKAPPVRGGPTRQCRPLKAQTRVEHETVRAKPASDKIQRRHTKPQCRVPAAPAPKEETSRRRTCVQQRRFQDPRWAVGQVAYARTINYPLREKTPRGRLSRGAGAVPLTLLFAAGPSPRRTEGRYVPRTGSLVSGGTRTLS